MNNTPVNIVPSLEGYYECPSCGWPNYIDSYDYIRASQKGSIVISCPECETKLRINIKSYESDNYPEL